jgi:hypothetical protein
MYKPIPDTSLSGWLRQGRRKDDGQRSGMLISCLKHISETSREYGTTKKL